jgi:hypothetical protein
LAHKAGPTRVEAAVGEQDVHTVAQALGMPEQTEQVAKHISIRRVMPGKVLPEVHRGT